MKAVTKLSSRNRFAVHQRVDCIHVGESHLHVVLDLYRSLSRKVRRELRKDRPLRRGLIVAACERHTLNRELFARVTSGR